MNCPVAPIDDLFRVARCEGKISTGVTRISACCGEAALERIGQFRIADCSDITTVANTFEIVVPVLRRWNPHLKVDDRIGCGLGHCDYTAKFRRFQSIGGTWKSELSCSHVGSGRQGHIGQSQPDEFPTFCGVHGSWCQCHPCDQKHRNLPELLPGRFFHGAPPPCAPVVTRVSAAESEAGY